MARSRLRALAFAEGQEAYRKGLPPDSNPYAAGSEQAERWDAGWKSMHARSIEHAPREK
jgi:hypothetical protein